MTEPVSIFNIGVFHFKVFCVGEERYHVQVFHTMDNNLDHLDTISITRDPICIPSVCLRYAISRAQSNPIINVHY